MEFDNSFEVPLPPAEAWALLMDIERIAPCMPGARLTEVVDSKTYKGDIAVRLGPVSLTFAGTVTFDELDAVSHTARVRAQGTDAKGRGGAQAAATFRIEQSPSGSVVKVHTDLSLSGMVASYGRGVGMIQSTAALLMKQFAQALRAQVIERAGAGAAPAPSAAAAPSVPPAGESPAPAEGAVPRPAELPRAKPIGGLSLVARALWDAVLRFFTRRPSGGSSRP
jgi:carbon monoxide dehydrogenase subunit G